jgi:hypothetical protein
MKAMPTIQHNKPHAKPSHADESKQTGPQGKMPSGGLRIAPSPFGQKVSDDLMRYLAQKH